MSLGDMISILGCVAVAVSVLAFFLVRFIRLEAIYQAKSHDDKVRVTKRYNSYLRYCIFAAIAGLLVAIFH